MLKTFTNLPTLTFFLSSMRNRCKTRLELDILPISEYTVGGWVARA